MRPLLLEVEGLTSFKERAVVDFSGLDLFALTGPTGVGKSSLIDAMVLALYGQVPRVGREYKQLISQGAERLSVRLDFRVGGDTYRVARTIRAAGAPQVRLERVKDGMAESMAGRVKEIEEQIEGIVGLDYDAFTRSVVLPQGQFDAFLKGKPEERRKILVSLLNLGVYERMHGIVNRRAAEARREAEFIGNQLASDFAQATPESLAARREELAAAEAGRESLVKAQAALARGLEAAQEVRRARREVEGLDRDARAERDRLAEAGSDLERAKGRGKELEARLAKVRDALAQVGFDERRHLLLVEAKPRAEQLQALVPSLERLEAALHEAERALERKRQELARAEKALPALERAVEKARSLLEAARAEREELRRRHAAHELRRHLKRGEPCPVCEQVVKTVPKGKAPALEAAGSAVREAEQSLEQVRRTAEEGRLHVKGLRGEADGLAKELAQHERQRNETASAVASTGRALEEAGFTARELADPKGLVERLRRELASLERAKAERDRLEGERSRVEAERSKLEAELAGAEAQAKAARERIRELEERRVRATRDLERSARALADLARREGWEGLAPAPGRDEVDLLESRRAVLQKEQTALAGTVARLGSETERLEQAIARAAELLEKKKALEADAALAATLAQHLQANQFIAYVQEEALRVLAEDGSRHLRTLSQERYSLCCDAQDFFVLDHWNADMRRSVKTLSGGETFLASLALALALAERLAELSAEGRAGETLESLFLDEGFGTLDAETLDVVVQAIEALQGGHRMVGVVTHIQELAERLPARISVSRSGAGALVSPA